MPISLLTLVYFYYLNAGHSQHMGLAISSGQVRYSESYGWEIINYKVKCPVVHGQTTPVMPSSKLPSLGNDLDNLITHSLACTLDEDDGCAMGHGSLKPRTPVSHCA